MSNHSPGIAECPTCKGSKVDPFDWSECRPCEGTGKVETPTPGIAEEIREVEDFLLHPNRGTEINSMGKTLLCRLRTLLEENERITKENERLQAELDQAEVDDWTDDSTWRGRFNLAQKEIKQLREELEQSRIREKQALQDVERIGTDWNTAREELEQVKCGWKVEINDTEPLALSPGDKVIHLRFGGAAGIIVKIAKSNKRALVKWPECAPAYYEIQNLKKVD